MFIVGDKEREAGAYSGLVLDASGERDRVDPDRHLFIFIFIFIYFLRWLGAACLGRVG